MVGRNPRRRELPDKLEDFSDDLLIKLYSDLGWSSNDIADEVEVSRHLVCKRLQKLDVDTTQRNRGPVRGPARRLWKMDPDEADIGGGSA